MNLIACTAFKHLKVFSMQRFMVLIFFLIALMAVFT